MCSEYEPPEQGELFSPDPAPSHKVKLRLDAPYKRDVWPGYSAPFLPSFDRSEWLVGSFGMLPHWADAKLARSTYNARTETVAQKPSYRNAWKHRQLAAVPVASFFEPNYESGKAVRWRIKAADGRPFFVAGLWEKRPEPIAGTPWSFTMLTVNADGHPLMQRFHRPEDEKRSIVVLDEDEVMGWLDAKTDADLAYFLRTFDPARMVAHADPLPPRKR